MHDIVDEVLDQWAKERPDLDVYAMGVLGRLVRVSRLTSKENQSYFASRGMEAWEFDVLATLRRSGPPYMLSPKDLLTTTMVSAAALTNRVDRLVARELVTREVDPGNRRKLLISLTPKAVELVDRIVDGYVANERRLLDGLSPHEKEELNRLLRKLLISFGDTS